MSRLLAVFILTASLAAQGPQAPGPSPKRPQPGTISGRLFTHDGAPASGVRVAALEVGNALFPDSQALMSIALTEPNGRYRLEGVPPGRYVITAGGLDLPTYYPGADAAAGAGVVTMSSAANLTGVNFSLAIASGLRFSGKVIRQDNDGRTITTPVAPASSSSQPMQIRLQGQNAPGNQTAVVGADGSFDFPQVRPGTYRINIAPSQPRMPQVSVTLLDSDITNYELVVPLMVQVTGTVTVEEGGPAPRFPIVFSNAGDRFVQAAVSGSTVQQNVTVQAAPRFNVQVPVGASRVTVGDVPGGFAIKRIVAGGLDLSVNPLLVTPDGAPQVQVILSAAFVPWVQVSGRVNGRSIPNGNAINVTSSQGNSSPLEVALYLDGSFEIPKALPGTYRVGGAGGPASADLVVPGGVAEVRNVVIDVGVTDTGGVATPLGAPSSAVRVSGRIVGRAKSQSGAQVRIENAETGEFRSAPIYVDGSFEFQHMQPGNYVARVAPSIPGAEPKNFTVGVRDISDFQLLVPAFRDIPGRITLEGAGEPPRTLSFIAASTRNAADVRSDGSFTVALPDGFPVTLPADALPESYAVGALKYGTLDLLADPMRLAGPATELQVALKTIRGTASVSGRVSGDTAALGESRVWLTDTNGRQRSLETALGPNGAFVFSNVGEGAYTVSLVAPGIPANAVSAAVAVTTGRNVAEVNLTAPRAVRGRVTADGAAWPQRFGLRLGTTIVIDPQRDGSFSVFLPTGESTVGPITGLPAGVEIQAITYGSVDLLKTPLRIPAADALEELTIQLRSAPR